MKNKLYYIRTQRNLTLKDVSELYFQRFGEKLPVRKLIQIEAGDFMPSLYVYLNLAELFDVTIDYLLCRSDTPDEEVRMHQKGFVEPDI